MSHIYFYFKCKSCRLSVEQLEWNVIIFTTVVLFPMNLFSIYMMTKSYCNKRLLALKIFIQSQI